MKVWANWRNILARLLPLAAPALLVSALIAEEQLPRKGLDEPVFREAKVIPQVGVPNNVPPAAAHPLDPALDLARAQLEYLRQNIKDYSCTLIKRERIGTELKEHQYMYAKVRSRRMEGDKLVTPLSVYLNFMKPKSMDGREVLYVEGQNNGRLVAHEGKNGFGGRIIGNITVDLDPNGAMAMRDNRYPITEVGLENLMVKLLEKGERDRQHGECEVQFIKGAKINGRVCTCLEVKHPVRRDYFEFHIARIFIDDEMKLPVRYEAYEWPTVEGGKPELTEEYTYLNLKVNQGFTDADFDRKNPAYSF